MSAGIMKNKFFTIKKYCILTKAGILVALTFRTYFAVIVFGNLLNQIIVYFLWKAVYASTQTGIVNGMTFKETIIYVVLAAAIFNFMEVYLAWEMQRSIQSGKIVLDILKPINFGLYMFFSFSGNYIAAFLTTFLPTFLVVYFITDGTLLFGINLLFFLLSLIIAIIINFTIDFFVGIICIYTESIWGVNIMKEAVVLLLSGAMIPFAFFPEMLRKVVEILPFQAIYNIPLKILINKSLTIANIKGMLFVQLFWMTTLILICHLFYKKSIKIFTVNGG